jgi:hypothetical protein
MTEPYLFKEWKPNPDRNREGRIQIAVVRYVNLVAPEVIVFHIPNGGWRGKTEASRFKALGVLPGIPDLILALPGGRTAWWEIKADGGRISPVQKAIFSRLDESGHKVTVIRSIDEARSALKQLGVKTKETAWA